MKTTTLSKVEFKDLVENKTSVLPDKFCVLPYETFKDFFNSSGDEDTVTLDYLSTINALNEKVSGTIVPHFSKLDSLENKVYLTYTPTNFDADLNYIGSSTPIPFKAVIRREYEKLSVSPTPNYEARTKDFTFLIESTL